MTGRNLPAPVVPPSLLLARTLGDCSTVRSRPAMVMSSVVALASTMPRSREGRGWEKRKKDSGEMVRSRVGLR